MKHMNSNKYLFKIGLEQKTAIIPCPEIADALGLEDDNKCNRMATSLLNLAYSGKNDDELYKDIDKFIEKYVK